MALINGTSGNDVLSDTTGQDTLNGLGGDDIITVHGPAYDSADGGDGNDTLVVDYHDATAVVTVQHFNAVTGSGTYFDVPNRAVDFSNFEHFNLMTGSGDDFLITGSGSDTISSGAGADDFDTGRGTAVVDGGSGVDLWRADFSDTSTAVNFDLNGDQGAVVALGNGSTVTNVENLLLVLGSGNDQVITGSGAYQDDVTGGAGDDILVSKGGHDMFHMGDGVDVVSADFSQATTAVSIIVQPDEFTSGSIKSADGVFQLLYWDGESISVQAGSANDLLSTDSEHAYADTLSGGGGDDQLNTWGGKAVVDGGSGFDYLYANLSYTSADIVLDLNQAGTQHLADGSAVTGIEQLTLFLGDGDDRITTIFGAANVREGDSGIRDEIHGGGGDDLITSGGGGDLGDDLYGDAGTDTLVIQLSDRTTTLDVIEGLTPGDGTFGNNHFYGFESLAIHSGSADDQLQTLTGAYADSVWGGAGADNIFTFAGDDFIDGGAGADFINGGDGTDTASYADATGAVSVNLETGTFGGEAGLDTLISIERYQLSDFADSFTGSTSQPYDDLIQGLGGNDTLIGAAGDDTLDGGTGADVLTGGVGDDVYVVDNAGDLVHEDKRGGTDTVQASANYHLTGNVEDLVLTGSVGHTGIGNKLDNHVTGSDGNDGLNGGKGDDTVDGGAGRDKLTGGKGDDVFSFSHLGDSSVKTPDSITDLAAGDSIDLHLIDADANTAGDQAFHLVAAFSGAAGELTLGYDAKHHRTVVQGDVNGDGKADFGVWIAGDHHDFTDFVL